MALVARSNTPTSTVWLQQIGPYTRSSDAGTGIEVVSDLLLQLRDVTIGSLRKRVVHQHAYRPNREETQIALESEVVLLYRLEKALRVGDFNDFSAGVVR